MNTLTRDIEVAGIKALLLARGARLHHGHVEAELREKLASSIKREKELEVANDTLTRQVKELQEKIETGKKTLADVEECLNPNIDLGVDLRKKEGEIEKLTKACKDAESIAKSKAKELQDSKEALLVCMKEAKVLIDGAFAKGGMESSSELPEADLAAFSDWLTTIVGQFEELLHGALDIGAYGAAIGLSRTLQELNCDHLKTMGRPSHKFSKLDSVREAVRDNL